jgi:hypothetical protein
VEEEEEEEEGTEDEVADGAEVAVVVAMGRQRWRT